VGRTLFSYLRISCLAWLLTAGGCHLVFPFELSPDGAPGGDLAPPGDAARSDLGLSDQAPKDAPVTARSLMELLNAAYALHPAFGEARVVEVSSGVRPAYPDNLPRVSEQSGTVFVNGFYRHGFLLAPAIARQAAATVFADAGYKENEHETDRQRRDG